MTSEDPQKPKHGGAFAGAARADDFLEDEHTMLPDAAREAVRRAGVVPVSGPQTRAPRPSSEPVPITRARSRGGAAADTAPAAAPSVFAPPTGLATPAPVGPRVAKKGLRGTLSKVGIRMAPGVVELAELEAAELLAADERTVRQATWNRAVGILVANPKGGVGKTPTSLIIGGILGSIRGGSVCVLEVSDDAGALAYRAEGTPGRGVGELVAQVETITSAGKLAGYTAPQSSFASVIGSVAARPVLTRDDVVAASSLIDEFYAIRVMDSGNQSSSAAFEGALTTADVLVVPILNAGDAALEAIGMLRRLQEQGGHKADLVRHAVVVRLSDGRPEQQWVTDEVTKLLADAGVKYVHSVPYDEHIAERGEISVAKLAPETYRAFTAATAAVIRSLQIIVR